MSLKEARKWGKNIEWVAVEENVCYSMKKKKDRERKNKEKRKEKKE